MRVFELAQKLKVTESYIHSVMRSLKTKKGMKFTRRGWQYELTPKEVRAIVKEIERRKGGSIEITKRASKEAEELMV